MSFKSTLLTAVAALSLATTAFGGDTILVHDPYIRATSAKAKSAAAFMTLENTGTRDDRLIGVGSDIAKRVELHTHAENAEGVMRMMMIQGGVALPAGARHSLQRGGDHVMFMGLDRGLAQGEVISLTLTFENAGEVTLEVPVDNLRKPGQ